MRPGYFHGAVNQLKLNVSKYVSQATLKKNMLEIRCHTLIQLPVMGG